MLDFTGPIFVYTCPVDMRKSIDGLSILISDFISQPITGINNPVESSEPINVTVNDASLIFLFINRTRDKIKILIKESNGFCLVYKRLDRGCFKINLTSNGPLRLSRQHLRWLLDGLDYAALNPYKSASYSVIF